MSDRSIWLGLKMATAYNHLHQVLVEHKALVEGESYKVINDLNPSLGYLSVKVQCPRPIPPEWNIHIGESLYQMRSVLDHLACLLAEKNGKPPDEHTEFPIFLERNDFWTPDGTYRKGVRTRIEALTAIDRAIIESEQPFEAIDCKPADDPLWLLYRMSNYDRHQFIHLLHTAVWDGSFDFSPKWFSRHVTQVQSKFGVGTFEDETEIARFSINYDGPQVAVKVNSKVTFGIAFGDPSPAFGLNVNTTMRDIGLRVSRIVGRLMGLTMR